MANINLSKSFGSAIFEGFGGIDRACVGKGGVGVVDLNNFRVGIDGTLTKRSGFAPLAELPEGKLRAICAASKTTVFALVGSSIYEIDTQNATCTFKKAVADSDTDACFFYYANVLHLIDGNEIYSYDGENFIVADGYIPLYGKNWTPLGKGDIYEPINALSTKIRISYKVENTNITRLVLPYPALTIDHVTLNGISESLTHYPLLSANVTLVYLEKTYSEGDVIEVFFTPKSDIIAKERAKLVKCTHAQAFGVGSNEGIPSMLALYGDDPHRVFVAKSVSEESYATVRAAFPSSTPMYFDQNSTLEINHNDHPICASCKIGAGLALFTESSAYIIDQKTDEPRLSITPISHTSGSAVKNGAITLENSPITLSKNGILLWTPSKFVDGEYVTECISLPISELIKGETRGGCVAHHSSRGELWFYRANDRRVWIYNTQLKCWYSFSGFNPEAMFEVGGEMAFVSDSVVYAFDESEYYDITPTDAFAIEASVTSNTLSFGAPNRKKRLSRAMVAFLGEGELLLTVTDAYDNPVNVPIRVTEAETIGYYETRIPAKRARYYSFVLSHGDGPLKLYAIALSAVK